MAWCCQATSHCLSQFWPRFMSPYGIIRPLWVNASCYLPLGVLQSLRTTLVKTSWWTKHITTPDNHKILLMEHFLWQFTQSKSVRKKMYQDHLTFVMGIPVTGKMVFCISKLVPALLTKSGITTIKMGWFRDLLTFVMQIPIFGKMVFILKDGLDIEMGPALPFSWLSTLPLVCGWSVLTCSSTSKKFCVSTPLSFDSFL